MSDGVRWPMAVVHDEHYTPGKTVSAESWSSLLQAAYFAHRYHGDVLCHVVPPVAYALNSVAQVYWSDEFNRYLTTDAFGGVLMRGFSRGPVYTGSGDTLIKCIVEYDWAGDSDGATLDFTFYGSNYTAGSPTVLSQTVSTTATNSLGAEGFGEQALSVQMSIQLPSAWASEKMLWYTSAELSSGASALTVSAGFRPRSMLVFKELVGA